MGQPGALVGGEGDEASSSVLQAAAGAGFLGGGASHALGPPGLPPAWLPWADAGTPRAPPRCAALRRAAQGVTVVPQAARRHVKAFSAVDMPGRAHAARRITLLGRRGGPLLPHGLR